MIEGKKSAMNREKMIALDSIGFFWMAKQKDSSLSNGSSGSGVSCGVVENGAGYGDLGMLDMMGVSSNMPPSLMNGGGGMMTSMGMGQSEGYGEDVDDDDDGDDE